MSTSAQFASLEALLGLLADPKATKAKLDELKRANADATEARKTMAELAAFKAESEAAYEELHKRFDEETAATSRRFAEREVALTAREKRAADLEAKAIAHEKEAQAKLDEAHARFRKAFG